MHVTERRLFCFQMLDEGTNVITMAVPTERQKKRPYTIDQFNGSPKLNQWAKSDEPTDT